MYHSPFPTISALSTEQEQCYQREKEATTPTLHKNVHIIAQSPVFRQGIHCICSVVDDGGILRQSTGGPNVGMKRSAAGHPRLALLT